MPDQRVITSTLTHHDGLGKQRITATTWHDCCNFVGLSVFSLWGSGDFTILNKGAEEDDKSRIERWLGGKFWRWIYRWLEASVAVLSKSQYLAYQGRPPT